MCLSVEDPLAEIDGSTIVKEQIKILQRFCKEVAAQAEKKFINF